MVLVDRTAWLGTPDDIAYELTVERRVGNGPWLMCGTSKPHGGVILSDNGVPWAMNKWYFTLPPGKKRELRVTVNMKKRLRTSVDIDALIRTR
jgi:hypothetical protein